MESPGASSWIDNPVSSIIDYFSSMTISYMNVAIQLGKILALCGIIWCCIQMVFGTMESRKFITGIVTKWFLFLVCLLFFPTFSRGLRYFAIELGTSVSGKSVATIQDSLAGFYQDLKKLSEKDDDDLEQLKEEMNQVAEHRLELLKQLEENANQNINLFNEVRFGKELAYDIEEDDKKLADYNKQKLQLEKRKDSSTEGYRRTLNAIRSVLILDDTQTIPKYNINLPMKNANGEDTGYLSPNALLRLSMVAAQIMWETEWQEDFMDAWEKKDSDGNTKYKKNGEPKKAVRNFPVSKLFNVILCFISMVMLLVITIIELIQYIMCIVEYSICSSFCIILIPCLLFDGLKDMASKILPTLLAQAVKLSMIVLCMFFCTYMYLDIAVYVASGKGFSITQFGYVAFVILLTFALCSNAPKLAVTLLSGQPQMSMGEFVQAAGAIAGGAHLAGKVAAGTIKKTTEFGRNAIGKTSQSVANRLGDAAAMVGAGNAARMAAQSAGKGKVGQAFASMGGAISAIGSRTGNRIKGKMQDMATYTGKRGGSGGGFSNGSNGTGNNRFRGDDARYGAENDSRNGHTLNYIGATNSNGSKMTLGEYMRDQFQGGQNIGANRAMKKYGSQVKFSRNIGNKGLEGIRPDFGSDTNAANTTLSSEIKKLKKNSNGENA